MKKLNGETVLLVFKTLPKLMHTIMKGFEYVEIEGLLKTQDKTLMMIYDAGNASMNAIARRVNLGKGSLTPIIQVN